MIVVAPRNKVFVNEILTFQGVNSDKEVLKRVVQNIDRSFSIMRRGDAEEDTNFKQPIPYAVLKRRNDVFIYERLQGGGEARLHNQLSLGVGGHINGTTDYEFNDLLYDNLRREIEEELYLSNDKFEVEVIGLINDDENSVGRVHIGLLAIIELSLDTDVRVREVDQLKGGWIQIKDLKNEDTYNNLETWSQFVADILNQ